MLTVSYAAPDCIVSYPYPLKYVPSPVVPGGVTSGGRGSDISNGGNIGGGGDNTGGEWMVQNDHWHVVEQTSRTSRTILSKLSGRSYHWHIELAAYFRCSEI
jgi:hypothetical protein